MKTNTMCVSFCEICAKRAEIEWGSQRYWSRKKDRICLLFKLKPINEFLLIHIQMDETREFIIHTRNRFAKIRTVNLLLCRDCWDIYLLAVAPLAVLEASPEPSLGVLVGAVSWALVIWLQSHVDVTIVEFCTDSPLIGGEVGAVSFEWDA